MANAIDGLNKFGAGNLIENIEDGVQVLVKYTYPKMYVGTTKDADGKSIPAQVAMCDEDKWRLVPNDWLGIQRGIQKVWDNINEEAFNLAREDGQNFIRSEDILELCLDASRLEYMGSVGRFEVLDFRQLSYQEQLEVGYKVFKRGQKYS